MKIGISVENPDLASSAGLCFGRANWLLIVDSEDATFTAISNVESQAAGECAGLLATRLLVDAGAKVLITGQVGLRAYYSLRAECIQIYYVQNCTAADALDAWRKGMPDRRWRCKPSSNTTI